MNDRDDAQEWAQLYLEREQMAVEALERCWKAGGKLEDIQTLADELGVSKSFNGQDARR